MYGIFSGTALLQVLQNLLVGIPSSLNFAVMGAVILLGVGRSVLENRQKKVASAVRAIRLSGSALHPHRFL